MSAEVSRSDKLIPIGRGSHGIVYRKGTSAYKNVRHSKVKEFSYLHELGASIIVRDIPGFLKIKGRYDKDYVLQYKLYDTSLQEWISKSGHTKYYLERSEEIIVELILAIRRLHNLNLIHGDIKPSNILVSIDGLDVVICDYGNVSNPRHFIVKHVTPLYRCDTDTSDYSVDIYSLGITMLDLFSDKNQEIEIKERIETVDERWRTIIKSCINVNQSGRPTIDALLNMVISLLDINVDRALYRSNYPKLIVCDTLNIDWDVVPWLAFTKDPRLNIVTIATVVCHVLDKNLIPRMHYISVTKHRSIIACAIILIQGMMCNNHGYMLYLVDLLDNLDQKYNDIGLSSTHYMHIYEIACNLVTYPDISYTMSQS